MPQGGDRHPQCPCSDPTTHEGQKDEVASRQPPDGLSQTPAGQPTHYIKLPGQLWVAPDYERQFGEIRIPIAVLNR